MRHIIKAIFIAVCLISQAHAGGYLIPEQGAKATGLANAFAGVADDPSALWYNPAGVAFQDGSAIMMSADVIAPNNEFTSGGVTYDGKDEVFFVPQTYIVYKHGDSPVSFGLAINSPFGLATDWSNSFAPFSLGSAGGDGVTFSKIEAAHFNPNIIYRINDHWGVAAGVSYYNVYNVNLDNQVLLLEADGDGWGGNAAVFYHRDDFNFGVSYRSRVKVDLEGTAHGGSALGSVGLAGVSGAASTSITFPDIVATGASYTWGDWLVSAQVDWVKWSEFDQIDIAFAPSLLNVVTGSSSVVPENWDNTFAYRLGVQWSYLPNMRARIGYTYDPTPLVDADFSPRLPGNDRQLFTVGHGMDLFGGKATIDMAYMFVLLDDRTQTASTGGRAVYNGLYESSTHLFSGALTYRF
ncbi:MAG: outer membrane protein transport protein [Mariprofundaceae bacterium]